RLKLFATAKPTASSTTKPAVTFSCVHIPAFVLHTAFEHIKDICGHPPLPQLERARPQGDGPFHLERCHGQDLDGGTLPPWRRRTVKQPGSRVEPGQIGRASCREREWMSGGEECG